MKVLFVTPYLPLETKPRPFQFITRLALDHEVHLIIQDEPGALQRAEGRADLEALRRSCERIDFLAQPRGRSHANCLAALATGEPLRVAYCRSPKLTAAVTERLRDGAYDVLHVDRERLGFLGQAAKDTQVQRVLDYTDAVSVYNEAAARVVGRPDRRAVLRIDASRMRRFEARVRRHFDSALITAPGDRAALGGGRVPDVAVVPNGVDLKRFSPDGADERGDRIAFVGSMSYLPNADAARFLGRPFIQAIRRRRPGATVVLVGADPGRSLRRLAGGPVKVTGFVPDVRAHLRQAALVVVPLRVGGGFSNKLAEAMAMGKAVLASPEVAAGLDVEAGVHLEVADRRGFAAAAADLLADPERRARLGAAARRYAERRLDWDPVMESLLRCYRRAP